MLYFRIDFHCSLVDVGNTAMRHENGNATEIELKNKPKKQRAKEADYY